MNVYKIIAACTLSAALLGACGPTPTSVEPAPPGDTTIGTVSTIQNLVQAGPIGNLETVSLSKNLYREDAVRVTDGGEAQLNFFNQIYLNLFNDTSVGGVNVEVADPTINRIRMKLERGGLTGQVEKESGGTYVEIANGVYIYILGTQFYITYDDVTDTVSAGNFDGTVYYQVPGQPPVFLPAGSLIDVLPGGVVQVANMPFNIQEFEMAAQTAGSAIQGLKDLLPPSVPIPIPTDTLIPIPMPAITSTREAVITVPPPPAILPCSRPASWVIYIVQSGDNLYQIGLKYGVTAATLRSGNCMGSSSRIYNGQILYVPNVTIITPTSITLIVDKNGTGIGTVTSNPIGINCGSICASNFPANTSVTLIATPAQGSSFGGWGGACAGIVINTCTLTMNTAKSVTANFTTTLINSLSVSKSGTGIGTVTSNPAGINCGSICASNFPANTSVTLTATPAPGSSFTGWGGACANITTNTCALTMDAAKSVTANFTIILNSLSVSKSGTGFGTVTSNPAGINCGSICASNFPANTSVTLTATPAPGSSFGGWGGACAGININTCTLTMDAAKSVTANFTIILNSLSVSNGSVGSGIVTSIPAGINCGSFCISNFSANTSVTLTATAAQGYSFTGWGGACSGVVVTTCALTMNDAKSVTANFAPIPSYSLSVSKSGAGSGTVTSNPVGINCGSICASSFPANTSVTLTATPALGSSFAVWGGACAGAYTNTCALTMDAAKSVTANFTIILYSLSVSNGSVGSGIVTSNPAGINCGSFCISNFSANISVTLTATAAPGYSFTSWGGACSGIGVNTCALTMNAAKSVTANFAPIPSYSLSVSKSGAGSGTVTSNPVGINCGSICASNFPANTSVTLTATPALGSSFAVWGGACAGIYINTCTLTMDAAKSVTANFTTISYSLSVSKSGTGAGTVASSPLGINCGSSCTYSFLYNTLVTLTATPAQGSSFTVWGGACTGIYINTCTLTMDAAKSVTANFTTISYSLSVSKSGTGAGTVTSNPAGINCGSICSSSLLYNTSVTLTASPESGSSFTGWATCAGIINGNTCTLTMDAAKFVTANFTPNLTLTVIIVGSGGTVTSSPSGINCGFTCTYNFSYNESVTLTAIALEVGPYITGWGEACAGIGTGIGDKIGTCTLTMDAEKSVTVTFDYLK